MKILQIPKILQINGANIEDFCSYKFWLPKIVYLLPSLDTLVITIYILSRIKYKIILLIDVLGSDSSLYIPAWL